MKVVVVDHNNEMNHHTIITDPYSIDDDDPMISNYIHDTEIVDESTMIRINEEIEQQEIKQQEQEQEQEQQQQKEEYDATTTTIHDDDDEISDDHVTIQRTSKVLQNNINDSTPTSITSNNINNTTIVLFYKYFIPSKDSCNSSKIQNTEEQSQQPPQHSQENHDNNNTNNNNYYYIHHYSNYYLNKVQEYIKDICHICNIKKGRILLSYEGINGTISSSTITSTSSSSSSSSRQNIQQFIHLMQSLDIIQQFGLPPSETSTSGTTTTTNTSTNALPTEFLFHNIDWKISTPTKSHTTAKTNNNNNNNGCIDPFPDLKISIVSEIISTGTNNTTTTTESNSTTTSTSTGITINDMIQYGGGIHISPQQFHTYIQNEYNNILLFDIRNTFEYDIGHFVCPSNNNQNNHNQNNVEENNNNNDNNNNDTMNENTKSSSSSSSSYVSAIHPKEMVQFSTLESILDQTIFHNNTDSNNNSNKSIQNELHTKKILLYCTGGIRCEKASVMFQKYLHQHNNAKTNNNDTNTTIPPIINNVYQLSGGIHRYIEHYGSKGFFKGKNFVFDQRIVQYPTDYDTMDNESSATTTTTTTSDRSEYCNNDIDDTNIVGRCIECNDKYDILCGSRICTVCRDLVLICNHCQEILLHGEYHCKRHQIWKTCYYTFLNNFTIHELKQQYNELTILYNGYITKPQKSKSKTIISEHDQQQQQEYQQPKKKNYKNIRRTLYKQMLKVQKHIHDMEQNGVVQDDSNDNNNKNSSSSNRIIIRHCRTCMEPNTICDGKCWGFWKQYDNTTTNNNDNSTITEPILPMLTIGTIVEPGPDWNELRFGTKYNIGTPPSDKSTEPIEQPQPLRRGIVVDVKTWGSNSTEYDCVAVSWFTSTSSSFPPTTTTTKASAPLIYRWGVIARNGKRMYDLQRVNV